MRLCDFIESNSSAIMQAWQQEARRKTPPAAGLDPPALIDHLPQLLQDFAAMIRAHDERPSATLTANAHADEHAWVRIEQGFHLEHVVRELALLRACILQLWRAQYPGVSVDEAELLARAVDRTIERSVSRYFERRSQLLMAMEQIADAAFNLDDLDTFLQSLLEIFIRFAPSVDSAVVLLRDDDHVMVKAAIGLEEEVRERVTLAIGEGFAGTIAATRRPLLLQRAYEHPLVKSRIIRERKTLALYGVPLCVGDDLIGVAHIGSRVSENISEPEMRLFAALAQRATSAIAKHLLRARAQRASAELRAVMEAIPSPAFVGNRTRLTFANAAGLRVLGYPNEDAMMSASLEELAGHARDAATGETLRADETPFGRAIRGQASVREMLLIIDGEERVMRGHAGPISVAGATVGAAIVLSDITELYRAVHELEQTAEFRERFVGIVSHDLRNPLNAIAMSAGVIVRSPELPASLAKPVGRIFSNVDRMTKMIGDLLDFTRGRLGGGIPIQRRPTSLGQVARRVIEEFEQTHPDRRIECGGHGDTHGEWDADRLGQLVANLLANAMQYGAPHEPVRVAVDGDGDAVTLTVRNVNAGAPISRDLLPHIFDPFRRADPERMPREGLGLGLFIASEIARAHGGEIRAASDESGTTFTVTVPKKAHPPGHG